MTKSLELLIEARQKCYAFPSATGGTARSFAYGNTAFENSLITRQMIDEQAEAIARESETQRWRRHRR